MWFELFERHADFIKQEIARRRAEGRRVIYLSCPISAKNGGFSATNVDVALYVARSVEGLFGGGVWVLNPALYQMESRAGTGLIERHARLLDLEKKHSFATNLEELHRTCPLFGGDYLRMWTRVIAEDSGDNLGECIDALYFMGPSDVRGFFSKDGRCVMDGAEDYLARKMMIDPEYQAYFGDVVHGEIRRKEFIEYYTFRVGAGFSYGSRDEFRIWRTLNVLRVKQKGLGAQIPAFSEGRQLNLLHHGDVFAGYALS